MTHAEDPSSASVTVAEAVSFLATPAAYPDHPGRVDVRETHMSWVFLTDRHVYKLKKPVRFSYLDYGTPAARRRNCQAEVRLNRRLAPWVYLAVVPLLRRPDGGLAVVGPGTPVDWLVKMVRLPAENLLDEAIAADRVDTGRLESAARLLAGFYRTQPRIADSGGDYAERLRERVHGNRDALVEDRRAPPSARVDRVLDALADFIDRETALLAERGARRVEGHGDLRPDHIYLGPPPAVIDCVEFNRDFRVNDPLDELAFLAMECDRHDAGWIGDRVLKIYAEVTAEAVPPRLIAFYKAHRALLRAKLSLWHLHDPDVDAAKWRRRTNAYLALAENLLDALD